MRYQVIDTGGSRSFPGDHPLLRGAAPEGEVLILIGREAGPRLAALPGRELRRAVLVELGTECLGAHTGERRGEEGSNVLGFARFQLGMAEPTRLVELVRQPRTPDSAIAAAREVLQGAGLAVALCRDAPGRILDRLVRPYFNEALRRLDEGLASADELDATIRLGLGYPEGPIALLERTGLAHHCDVSQALYEALGDRAHAPARRARIARMRAEE
jgi:3-hydroxybutyryl-CoA dehydrogenase